MTADLDFDARRDVPTYAPHEPYTRELDAERIVATWQYTTRDTLAQLRYETPRLTALSVLYDIVRMLRCPKEDESR